MREVPPDLFGSVRRPRVLVVAAHPDDETIGAGALLWTLSSSGCDVAIAHATDGAPLNMSDAHAHGFDTREAYAAAREGELREALSCLPTSPERFRFGFADQSLARRLGDAAGALVDLLRSWRPSVVLTHPYEGGHPDHDTVALMVTFAIASSDVADPPRHIEFTSYHLANGVPRSGVFLREDGPVSVVELTDRLRRVKEEMLACFVTQRETLAGFDAGAPEFFRPAPRYDFRQPPHAPPLLYDLYDWGIGSDEWRARAAAFLDAGSAACR